MTPKDGLEMISITELLLPLSAKRFKFAGDSKDLRRFLQCCRGFQSLVTSYIILA